MIKNSRCLTQVTIYQLYHVCYYYWWRKPEHRYMKFLPYKKSLLLVMAAILNRRRGCWKNFWLETT